MFVVTVLSVDLPKLDMFNTQFRPLSHGGLSGTHIADLESLDDGKRGLFSAVHNDSIQLIRSLKK